MNNNFAKRLKEAMDIRNIRQVELVEKTKISKSAISQYLSGAFVPKQKNTYKIAEALNVDPVWLMGKDVSMERKDYSENLFPVKIKKVPLLGEIAAGEPIYVHEKYSTYMEVDEDLNVDFCLKIKGDSMIGARILNEDIVFIRRQPCVENGEIAAVIIDDEVTLKRFYKNDGLVMLRPENPRHQPLMYTKENFKQVRILGKAIFFQSKL
ncbi:MAG TPA: S24 family peptidase [Clostridia bacterium]|nr:S24 family peptidase [Clostridia bacterium]